VSVLELIKAVETVSGIKIPYVIDPRRPGDIDAVWAGCEKAKSIL
jgi:UDP-glucose 4-epimerase